LPPIAAMKPPKMLTDTHLSGVSPLPHLIWFIQ
jgi:hypothetical protein